MPPVVFEPTILVSVRPKTHALGRKATEIGIYIYILQYINSDIGQSTAKTSSSSLFHI
jgi:hypothetical protein